MVVTEDRQPTQDDAAALLQKLVTAWRGKISVSLNSKKRKAYDTVCTQIDHFYSGTMGFMFTPDFQNKYTSSAIKPKFQITIAKAYELVSLFGPALYYRNPTRSVRPYKPIEFGPEVLGDPQDPNLAQQHQQMMQQQAQEYSVATTRAELMERYLSYTPREQPDGGLEQAAENAITEALLYGRGTLWSESFTMPGSERKLTGSFHYPTKDLIIDPDATSVNFGNCRWIARRCVGTAWELEREYRLKPGTLKKAATGQSGESVGAQQANDLRELTKQRGESHDLVTYYKIWSLGGVGTRLTGIHEFGQKAFDRAVGDYAYLVIVDGHSEPLNAPLEKFRNATTEEVGRMFSWPIPYWLDRRWPVAMLDFTVKPRSPYPIAPMEPGLGELVFINVLISTLAGRAWEDSRTIVACFEDVAEDVEKAMKSPDQNVIIRLKRVQKLIQENLEFLKRPELNAESWMILEKTFELFDKRVGLSELWYAMNPGGAASRTATDVQAKQEKASIRPDHMAKQVGKWMATVAQTEKLCAYFTGVDGNDVRPLLGRVGAQLWDMLVTTADPEVIVRETDATVEVNSSRKPNRERDLANLGQIMPVLGQLLDKHADATGDTGQINALITKWGNAMEEDVSELMMGQRVPPPPPPEQMQQQQQQMQEQAAAEQQIEQATFQAEQNRKQEEHGMELRQDQEKHDQDMTQDEQMARAKLAHQKAMTRLQAMKKPRTPQAA